MSSQPTSPVVSPPSTSPALTSDQWRTLFSITSAIIPATSPSSSNASLSRFEASSASADNEPFRKGVEQMFERRLPPTARESIRVVLNMLNSTPGCLLLTYSTTPFYKRPLEERERIIKTWVSPTSYLLFPPIRSFGLGMIQLAKTVWLRKSTADIYPAISYHGGVGKVKSWVKDDAWKKDMPWTKRGEEKGFYDAWEFIEIKESMELEADVVIVGSGCGGAVAAKVIAEAGLSVIIVEKGTWVPTDHLPLHEDDAFEQTFEAGLSMTSDNGGIALLAGSTFGGGGAVNWAASLQPPHYVRSSWAEDHNLPFFLSPDFQRLLDSVSERMGVTEPTEQNHRNSVLLSGAHKLGYASAVVPQNAPTEHKDPYCTNGCGCPPHARKMGTLHTFLPDASRAGARFITEFTCNSLLFSHANPKRVVGVSGSYGPGEIPVVVRAREVVVSAGAIHSPALLINSGFPSPLIGTNLHLHPAIVVHARFPKPVYPATGSPLTSLISSFEDLDGRGHGVRLEAPCMGPAIAFGNLGWTNGEEWKETVLDYQRMDGYIAIAREEQTGRIRVDERGQPRVAYEIGAKEQGWLLSGVEALTKVAFIEGADKIWAPVTGFPPFARESGSGEAGILDPAFQAWLKKLKALGLPIPGTMLGSAHQMGSCKMGATCEEGVVDMYGRVFGHEGVVVADASVLPSASGVNPMLTVMAVAGWIAEDVVKRLKGKNTDS